MKTAICAIIKDEHLFLEEWIEWHLGLGFDAIHLFEDKGSKSHEEICEKYSNVYLRRYEDDEQVRELLADQGSANRQVVLYDWFSKNYKGTYKWAAYIDIDEFVFFGEGNDLDRLCEEFEPYTAVLLSWRMMGANGQIERPSCGVVEAYTKEAVMEHPFEREWYCKSMVNIDRYCGLVNNHRAIDAVNTHHVKNHLAVHYDRAWLNHYFSKSWEDWCSRIFKRGDTQRGNRTLAQFFEINEDMLHLRDELIGSVADQIPNGTYWLDKKRGIIAGGNVRKIERLNAKSHDDR